MPPSPPSVPLPPRSLPSVLSSCVRAPASGVYELQIPSAHNADSVLTVRTHCLVQDGMQAFAKLASWGLYYSYGTTGAIGVVDADASATGAPGDWGTQKLSDAQINALRESSDSFLSDQTNVYRIKSSDAPMYAWLRATASWRDDARAFGLTAETIHGRVHASATYSPAVSSAMSSMGNNLDFHNYGGGQTTNRYFMNHGETLQLDNAP